jgi:hypothetical protein
MNACLAQRVIRETGSFPNPQRPSALPWPAQLEKAVLKCPALWGGEFHYCRGKKKEYYV